MSDWLDKAVQRTKKKYQSQRVREEQWAHEEAERRMRGGQFCRELFAWLEHTEMSFNNGFGSHVLAVSVAGGNGSRSVRILARPTRTDESIAELKYQETTSSLALSMGSGPVAVAKAIRLILSENGAILAAMGEEYYTPERLGQKIIDDLLA
jgi:hypothetical protein